jgi:hypothetical protein
MPAPTEEQILIRLIEALDDNSKTIRNLKIQKWFLFFTTIICVTGAMVGYKYTCIATPNLMILSGLAGMSLMGLIITNQMKYHTSLLKPYINVEVVNERIKAIKT